MTIRPVFLALSTSALLALAGCAGSQAASREDSTTAPASRQQGMQAMAGMCPMQVKGTKVEASNTESGAALTFTTTGDVAELRQRVQAMAEMHNKHHTGGSGMDADHGMHGGHGAGAACACPKPEGQGAQACACPKPEGQGAQACACPKHGGGAGHGMKQGMGMPASRATTEEVEGGIRLVLTPEDPAQADALRQMAQRHAERMSSGQCPMMQAPPQG